MSRPRYSYPFIVSCVVFLVLGPAMSAYGGIYAENRCYHKANKAEKIVRKLERKAEKACAKKFLDVVDGDYLSEVSVQSRTDRKVCWRQAEQNRAHQLGSIDDVRSQCLVTAGGEAWDFSI
ncbi:MAG: hypothetical protein O7E57_11980 [Gammaproteobacteria bacterium]|nr:hypothetical protein [Gammaproteobacteria bacterium]